MPSASGLRMTTRGRCSRRCRSQTHARRGRVARHWALPERESTTPTEAVPGKLSAVDLPLAPPIKPQLALTRKELPTGEEWAYEQKLDGFRAIVFVDGAESYIQSRGGKDLSRYFPELSFPLGRYVADGELVIRDAEGFVEFDALQSRIHPAESRIKLLSEEIPARFVGFDLLAE